MSDLIVSNHGCMERVSWNGHSKTGKKATGIDCFAEDVWHEWQHKEDFEEWWGGRFKYVLLKNNVPGYDDEDDDNVPAKIEAMLAGCSDQSPTSCAWRPYNNLPDVEVQSYWKGWQWKIGSVGKEDWSRCGKQWKDASVCPGGKTL